MNLLEHGTTKFPDAGLLASSADQTWRGVAAELRYHPACALPAFRSTQFEVTLAVEGNSSNYVHRCGAGSRQIAPARTGNLWLCPVGVAENETRITGELPAILHVYLPNEGFRAMGEQYGAPGLSGSSIRYLSNVDDALVRELTSGRH